MGAPQLLGVRSANWEQVSAVAVVCPGRSMGGCKALQPALLAAHVLSATSTRTCSRAAVTFHPEAAGSKFSPRGCAVQYLYAAHTSCDKCSVVCAPTEMQLALHSSLIVQALQQKSSCPVLLLSQLAHQYMKRCPQASRTGRALIQPWQL